MRNGTTAEAAIAAVKEIMPANPDQSPVSRELREVFHLGETG